MKKKVLFATLVLSLLTFLTYILLVSAVDFFISGSGSHYFDDVVWETTLNGTTAGDYLGSSVASGDVNNDSYADIIVGATGIDSSDGASRVYMFFGSADGVSDMDAVNANLTFNGTTTSDEFGISVSSGDVNNDSYADVIVGADKADPSGAVNAGQAYVFFGADYSSAVGITYSSTDANITFNGTTASDQFGWSVSSGDVNNDSYADVIVGANKVSGASGAGQAYVFFGADYSSAVGISYNATEDANITFNGTTANDEFGISVSSGDVNNDSYADVIVGAYYADPSGASSAGQAYVFFGADYSSAVGISYASTDANITFNGTTASDYLGYSVSSGDVNNDSYADVIAGAYHALSDAGQAYVFFGADYSSAVGITYNSTDANITFNGTTASDEFSWSVSSGDVNNDSYADVIVGAWCALSYAGQAYVFFGADYSSAVGIGYASTDANITFNGTTASDYFGCSVASGDVNNDSYTNVIVGACYASPSGASGAGQAYIFAYDDVYPVITLDVPADNSYDTDGDVNFSFTATESHPNNCILYFRSNATNWDSNESTTYSSNAQANFYANLTDAVYVWNVECNDTANNPAFASSNRTLTVDTVVPPTPTLTAPTDTSINPRDSISYTCESIDATAGISKWTWTLTKPQEGGTVTKTGGEVTSNSQSFSGDDTNLAGSYTIKCEAEDKAGHKSSSSSTFSVYYSHVSEGAGVGPSAAADIDLSTAEETTITEKQGVISTFTLDGVTIHTLKIKKVDEVAGTVTIIIESDPIEITLTIGETEEVDVDSDGENDISVTLNSIKNEIADITTKRLAPLPKKEVPTEEVTPEEAPGEEVTPTPEEAPSKAWLWILIIVVLIVIGVGYWFIKKKAKTEIVQEVIPRGKSKKK